jgi:hypothetical protein
LYANAATDCGEALDITQAQYESVRSNPRRFLVLPGHEDTDVARVVERHGHFLVVEKLGEEPVAALPRVLEADRLTMHPRRRNWFSAGRAF